MVTPRKQWLTFREFFELAVDDGVDQVEAGEALLEAVKASQAALKTVGVHKVWDAPTSAEVQEWNAARTNMDELFDEHSVDGIEIPDKIRSHMDRLGNVLAQKYDWKPRLPLNPSFRPVPRMVWDCFEEVSRELISQWLDDPEDPEQSARVDWLGGHLERYVWYFPYVGEGFVEIEFIREGYSSLSIETIRAKELIKKLSGAPNLRGAPSGPRNPEDRRIHDLVLAAISDGDPRDIGRIVSDFMPSGLSVAQDQNMRRRVKRNVNKSLQD